jgi:NAD(P)H-nitrite reductase large subunit
MGGRRRRLVILGNSAAALSAIRAIRSRGGDEHVTVVSREECHAYSPVLTTYYLRGVVPERRLFLCDAGSYRDLAVECRFGRTAVEIDTARQRVLLDDGARLDYDALLIATGAAPARLSGLDDEVAGGLCYLRTVEDARRIRRLAQRARHVAVLGAGLVSLQTAAAIARPGLRITCIVGSRQVLSQNLDADCAAIVQDHVAREGGIEFLFGRSVTTIAHQAQKYRIALAGGEDLSADMVVVGRGVTPNTGFVDPGQIALDRGVLVDDRLRTTAPNVYAAGDVAQGRNRISGAVEVVANWIDACEQGRVAGLNMTGADVASPGSVPENVTTLFGLPVASIGSVGGGAAGAGPTSVTGSCPERQTYRRVFLERGVPVGAILLGDVGDAGVVRAAILRADPGAVSVDRVARGPIEPGAVLRDRISGPASTAVT